MDNHTPWLAEAKRHQGLTEIKGDKHHPTILAWIKELGGWFTDDETPWCGTFVAHCLKTAGLSVPQHWYRAKAYASYGHSLEKPRYGAIAVFERQGGGHVGFVVGEDAKGNLMVLGGNQSNQVNIRAFSPLRLIACRWPGKNPPESDRLPLIEQAALSRESEEV